MPLEIGDGVRPTLQTNLPIPDATLVQNTVTNFTLRDPVYRLRAAAGVAYDSDLRQVMREPRALLTDFGDSSVNLEVSVWSKDPWGARLTRSTLNDAIR